MALTLAFCPAAAEPSTTVIGLFVPMNGPDAPAGLEVQRGAALALEEAGTPGRRFRLVSAASDVPWSAATGALVRLIYDQDAAAVIGALDAATAHLAEQVITRARGEAVFVTPWASEVSLTRVQIPWFFSVVPDDRRQAVALAREAFDARPEARVAVWVGSGLDAHAGAEAFAAVAPAGSVDRFDAADPGERERLATRLGEGRFARVVVFARPHDAAELVGWLRERGDRTPILGPVSLAAPGFLDAGEAVDGVLVASPGPLPSGPADRFAAAFTARHGVPPTLLARLGHDAAAAIVHAVNAAGTDRGDPLAAALSAGTSPGATGAIRFEARRGRDAAVSLCMVKGGALVPLDTRRAGMTRGATP